MLALLRPSSFRGGTLKPTPKHIAPPMDLDLTGRVAHAPDRAVETIVETLLSRLDAEQARAFLCKMAELDAEQLRRH